jgi:uncharacterized protein
MSKLQVSWIEYHRQIEKLAIQIYESGWEFDQILCLARGGLRVGDILSRIFDKPLAILAVKSYSQDGKQEDIKFASHLTMTTASLGDRLLVVDDLVDSGMTLQKTLTWLQHDQKDPKKNTSEAIAQVKTAVIWYKACSVFAPDFFVEYLPDNPWIDQPFEIYESMGLAQLKQRVQPS